MKPDYEKAVKLSVSMPAIMRDKADARRRQKSLTTFSDYIQQLIRNDIESMEHMDRKLAA